MVFRQGGGDDFSIVLCRRRRRRRRRRQHSDSRNKGGYMLILRGAQEDQNAVSFEPSLTLSSPSPFFLPPKTIISLGLSTFFPLSFHLSFNLPKKTISQILGYMYCVALNEFFSRLKISFQFLRPFYGKSRALSATPPPSSPPEITAARAQRQIPLLSFFPLPPHPEDGGREGDLQSITRRE